MVPNSVHREYWVARAFHDMDAGTVLQAPAVSIFSQWVAETAAKADLLGGRAAPVAAGTFEVLQLWEAAIERITPGLQEEERHALACQAREADRFSRQWPLAPGERFGSHDPRFPEWRAVMRAAMQERGWHTAEDWLQRLESQLRNGSCPGSLLPAEIVLTGFVELTDLERSLLDALVEVGTRVSMQAQPAVENGHGPLRHHFGGIEEELSAAAAWAAALHRSGRKRIAVIVNELEHLAGLAERTFAATLQPEAAMAFESGPHTPFHVTVTEPLCSHPLIADALLLLDLSTVGTRTPREFHLVSRALLSANWSGGREERFARATLERKLRQSGRYRWSLAAVSERAGRSPQQAGLTGLVTVINNLAAPGPGQHPAHQLLEWLKAWGWPGHRELGSRATAASTRFLGLLEVLSRQTCASTGECLTRLQRLCATERVPTQGGPLSPIVVMSPEQAYGQVFDAAWIANLTMRNWPARPVGNALLSQGSLRCIPRATEEGALAYARRVTRWLRTCAGEVRFSWCDRLDAVPVSPSTLIAAVPIEAGTRVKRATLWRAIVPAAAEISGYLGHPWLTELAPAPGRALQISGSEPLRGSVDLLNYQSACPLAAYLRHRLGARMERVPLPFADAAYRGELVHAALEHLYAPASNGGPALAGAVPAAVDAALDSCQAERHMLPAERLAMRESLQELLRAWLAFEGHGKGWHIEALEWRRCLEFKEFQFDVRVDRVERMADGRTFLLDYKTGRLATTAAWLRERPGNLQLPLYAVLFGQQEGLAPGGMAMAAVRMNEMNYVGLTDADSCSAHGIPGAGKAWRGAHDRPDSWRAALEHWRDSLAQLLDEYRRGDCRHLRFDDQALRYAGMDILLRGPEASRWVAERGDGGDD
jgi:probable DNA repair protein